MLKETKFSRLISLWQKVSGISLKYPPFFLFFEKDTSSDLWEVATCMSKHLWMMDDSIPIFLFAHRCWNCASLWLDAVGNGASKYISSWSLLIHPSWDWTDNFFSPPSRFDSMISSLIFGWPRVLSVLSARWDWSVCALDDVRERCFNAHLLSLRAWTFSSR